MCRWNRTSILKPGHNVGCSFWMKSTLYEIRLVLCYLRVNFISLPLVNLLLWFLFDCLINLQLSGNFSLIRDFELTETSKSCQPFNIPLVLINLFIHLYSMDKSIEITYVFHKQKNIKWLFYWWFHSLKMEYIKFNNCY